MTKYVYGIVHIPNAYANNVIPDTADIDVGYAWDLFRDDNDADYLTVVTLNPDDYWRGWFFYNDMDNGEDACPCDCNTQEHLDLHWESNSGGGHYDCLRYEHIVNDRIVTTRFFKAVGDGMFSDAVDITTHHQFENRLTNNDTDRTRRAYI
jgi:hypothetical protein